MQTTAQIATQLRHFHFGGNWTGVNMKDTLRDVTWEQATTKIHHLNTIVALVYHINYYIDAQLRLLQGQELTAKDKYSFDHPPVQSQQDWDALLDKVWKDAEIFATLIEQFPNDKLCHTFVNDKYGNYFRNFTGAIEHGHYHLGQIVIIKKMINEGVSN
jgi:hypothetical protein